MEEVWMCVAIRSTSTENCFVIASFEISDINLVPSAICVLCYIMVRLTTWLPTEFVFELRYLFVSLLMNIVMLFDS